jgi:hypothetical protein
MKSLQSVQPKRSKYSRKPAGEHSRLDPITIAQILTQHCTSIATGIALPGIPQANRAAPFKIHAMPDYSALLTSRQSISFVWWLEGGVS